ncbi:MAG: NAD(P)/FAD-dependent oxidoreductase [Alphaproteobacteria bacterium]|nr:NAD(P)/FAD-dependent oxidoreductase [Alphaproteobacteria bacterium]
MDKQDVVVIGAGVVGLAIARVLAMAGRDVLILEAEGAIGTQTSARNSEVIHAGLYYPKDSLKARFCVAGNRMLYAYCQDRGISHQRTGKLLVAVDETELELLDRLSAAALANGVQDLSRLSASQAEALEPELSCKAALLSPSTGIIDSHGLMLSLLADAEAKGAVLALKSAVTGGRVSEGGITLAVDGTEIEAALVVNSAGLGAWAVARSIKGIPEGSIPPCHFAKGNYFSLTGKTPFKRLVYPVPGHAGLGVHFTRDLAGRARFGPDVEWVDAIDYKVDPKRAEVFYEAIRSYWPGLRDGALEPGYAGIRPKLQGPGDPQQDFWIGSPLPGLIALYGIESPGLTSCLAIAEHVARMAA